MIINDQSEDDDSPPIKLELAHVPTGLELWIYLWDNKKQQFNNVAGLAPLQELISNELDGNGNGLGAFVNNKGGTASLWQRSARALRLLADQIDNAVSITVGPES